MVDKSKPPLVLIAGPTASGKSALAIEIAKSSNGVIVNADSAQLYRDIPTLSAAPSAAERAMAEHRLYGFAEGSEAMSAAEWAELARGEIDRIHNDGRLPILVGGTGLYLRTLLDGIAPVPPINSLIRTEIRESDLADNRARLEQADPEAAARLNPADWTRISRALEVVLSTGRTLKDWQSERTGGIRARIELRPLILLPPRPWLYARCDSRFSAMVANGAVEEVRTLLSRQLPSSLPIMRAIGVRELAKVISGEWTMDEAIAAGQQATRNYAKRQYTWFAHQPPPDWPRFTLPLDSQSVIASASEAIQ